MANNQNINAPSEWRSGRPSFKAFYPEVFFLSLITIAFIAVACKLSCDELAKSRNAAKPAPVEEDAPDVSAIFFAPSAWAQDASIDEIAQEPVAPLEALDSEPGAVPDDAVPVAEGQSSQEDVVVPEPVNAGKSAPTSPWVRIGWIWAVCLAIPCFLWIWRGWAWICGVFGVYYELRVDPDNPRATTFLTTRGIFNKKTDSMHISSIRDIQSTQSFVQKYFKGGVGTIRLFTKDLTDGILIIDNMAEPSRVFNAFDTLRRHYWSRGGMPIDSEVDGVAIVDAGQDF